MSPSPARSPAAMRCIEAASKRFIGLGLELGGCDPAYVRADADAGPCRREPGRRRLLQFGPILLRHPAHLCAQGPLQGFRRRRRRADARNTSSAIRWRAASISGRWCAPRRRTRSAARSRNPSRPGRAAAVDAEASSRPTSQAPPMSRRSSWSISTRPIPSCRRNASAPSPASCRSAPTTKRSA